jgi:hypothetical protein
MSRWKRSMLAVPGASVDRDGDLALLAGDVDLVEEWRTAGTSPREDTHVDPVVEEGIPQLGQWVGFQLPDLEREDRLITTVGRGTALASRRQLSNRTIFSKGLLMRGSRSVGFKARRRHSRSTDVGWATVGRRTRRRRPSGSDENYPLCERVRSLGARHRDCGNP